MHADVTIHALQNFVSEICWYERIALALSVNLTTPLTKRNIILPCTLALVLTINFSRYNIAR